MLSTIFAVLFYLATTVFAVGLAYRIRLYARTPAPLKIPTTPAPITRQGVVARMFREVAFFESLFKDRIVSLHQLVSNAIILDGQELHDD